MSGEWIANILLLAVPLLPVAVAPLLHFRAAARGIAPWVPLPALLLLPVQDIIVDYPWLLLGTRVGLTAEMAPLLVLAVVVWSAAGWHARRTLAITGSARFWFFWLATWCGNLCVFLTRDAASFYAAYAMMTFAAWGLVVHRQRPEDFRAGRVYMVMALAGEALLIAALLAIGAEAGNIDLARAAEVIPALPGSHWITGLLIAGFGVKMGLAGLHMWLPLAHPQAPVPASAVLSGVILKGGLAGWLLLLPLGANGFALPGHILLAAGIFTAFYGVGIGLCQVRPKTILAYSSLSQMGLVAAAVGIALAYPQAAPLFTTVAVLFAVHHGLAKGALFLGVDLVRDAPRTARALLWIPAASLAGLPLTSGMLAKNALKAELPSAIAAWLEPLLLLSSIATALILIHFLVRVWPQRDQREPEARAWPWLALLSASLVIPWYLAHIQEPGWISAPWTLKGLTNSTLPVLIAGAIALLAHRWRMQLPTVPEGDLLALWRLPHNWPSIVGPRPPSSPLAHNPLPGVERRLTSLATAVVVWLALVTTLILLGLQISG